MPIKVLVVDDSSFFCQQLTQILKGDPEIKIIGVAHNGREAIEKTQKLHPDVITMDVEMPVMDGITATRLIMEQTPTPILMLSSLTYEGAKLTLDALSSGAVDFLLKSYESLSASDSVSAQNLRNKVKLVARSRVSTTVRVNTPHTTPNLNQQNVNSATTIPIRRESVTNQSISPQGTTEAVVKTAARSGSRNDYKILVIGASTGGPVAVQKILTSLPSNFPIPVVVIQHMPGTFTGAFANRLNGLCKISVEEATDQVNLLPARAYIAPGGKQIYFEKSSRGFNARIRNEDPRVNYQPCVDISFASAAKTFAGKVLAFVLTGMGADGRDGARLLKQHGAQIWAQDQQSCVVYGMPMAVVNANLADKVLSIDDFTSELTREIKL